MTSRRSITALATGAFIVGTLDLLFAIGFWLPKGVAPIRILQSIASGLLGRSSFTSGASSALLGGLLHYFIALVIVLMYWLVARRVEILQRKPLLFGALYGIGVYLFMNYLVIPLSAAKASRFNLVWVVASVIVHMFLIGVPAALAARKALR